MGLFEFVESIIHNSQGLFTFIGQIPSMLMSLCTGLPTPLVSALSIILLCVIAFRIMTIIL